MGIGMRFILSWALYAMGDAVWRLSFGYLPRPLYALYNGLMTLSDDIQGTGPGPWKTPDEH